MKNIKYAILSLALALYATTGNANPTVQSPDVSEESLDPLLEVYPAETKAEAEKPAEDKEILDKAINEVFQEPKEPEEQKNAETKTTIEIDSSKLDDIAEAPAEAPEIDESAEPVALHEEPVKAPEAAVVETNPEIKAEAPVETKAEAKPEPKAEPKAEEKAEVPATPAATEAEAEPVKAETPAKAEKMPVAPEKVVAKKAPAKAKQVKKINFPRQTPKSLREDYLQPGFDGYSGAPAPITTPVITPVTVPAPSNEGLPENTRPIDENRLPTPTPVTAPAIIAPATDNSEYLPIPQQQVSSEKSELDDIQDLPSKKKLLKVKNDVNIDKGSFIDPFAAVNSNQPSGQDQEDPAPIDDLASDNQQDLAEALAVSEVSPKNAPAPENFYLEDTSLKVEVKDAPTDTIGIMKNAYEALQVGQYESAIKYYDDVLAIAPNNRKALFGIATAYHMSKDYEKAKEAYLKIIKIDPDYWPAVNNYIILVTEEDPAKSIPRLEELYSRNPSFAAIPAQLGNLYYKSNNIERSVDYYVAAIKLEPKNIEYRYNLAVILEKSGRNNEAAQLYRSLLDDAAKGQKLPENPVIIKERYDHLLANN